MTDYTELKPLLEACRAENCDGPREFRKAVEALFDVCTVETISALTSQIEQDELALRAFRSVAETAVAERDQLKAENEALRSDIQSWRLSIEAEREVHKLSLKGVQDELERLTGPAFAEKLAALRKDAERYQWLREARSGYIEVVEWIGLYATGMTGEDLDALLGAAMGKGEQP